MRTHASHLCPRCGYDLSGLEQEMPCPECMLSGRTARSAVPLAAAEPAHLRALVIAIKLWGWAALIGALDTLAWDVLFRMTNVLGPGHMLALDATKWVWVLLDVASLGAATLLCLSVRHGRVGYHEPTVGLLWTGIILFAMTRAFHRVDGVAFDYQLTIQMGSAWREALVVLDILALSYYFMMAVSLARISRAANRLRRASALTWVGVLQVFCGLVMYIELAWMTITGRMLPSWAGLFDWLGDAESFVAIVYGFLSLLLARHIQRVVIPKAIRLRETPPVPPS